MYVTGAGKTKFGVLGESLTEMMASAIVKSLEDSGKHIDEIDAAYVGNFCAGPFTKQLHLNSLVSSIIKRDIPILRIEAACASGGAAVYQTCKMMDKADNILVVGAEKMTSVSPAKATENISMAGSREMDQSQGLIFPGAYALIAQSYMRKYGATTDDLAHVSLKNHRNANKNSLAHFFAKNVTLGDIKNSKVVCSPLRLFDCSPMSDGAAAIVVSREKSSSRDIKILASVMKTGNLSLADSNDVTSFRAANAAAKEAYKISGVKPSDVDIAEVHDCFTIAEIIAMEDLELCNRGESSCLIRNGDTEMNGKIPVNPSGGLKAGGHPIGATGVSQIYEVVKQLRGESENQVENAKIGITHNVGGVGGTAVVHILKR